MKIDRKKAQEIAKAFYYPILEYLNAHKEEFALFLATEQKAGDEDESE